MNQTQGDLLSVSDAAHRVAQELSDMGARIETLEKNLEAVFAQSSQAFDGQTIQALQEIDMVVQTSAALAAFMTKVAEAAAADDIVPLQKALDAMPLKGMATRLRGANHIAADSGVAELF